MQLIAPDLMTQIYTIETKARGHVVRREPGH